MANVKMFEELYNKANEAGKAAAAKCVPNPMIVGQPTTLFGNDIDYTKQTYFVPDGVCGFAWVVIRPGNHPFANFLKKNKIAKPAYQGGVQVWVSAYNQSMQLKEAYATAFAKVLQDAGIQAYADSRMD
jgi:hypothetical protein